MKYIVLFFTVFMLIYSSPVLCQDKSLPKSTTAGNEKKLFSGVPNEVQSSCSQFLKSLIAGNVDKAFDDILKNSPINKKIEQLKTLKTQTKKSMELYGFIKAYEPVSSETVGESMLRVRYLALHDDFPMRWIFTFYNSPTRGWIVINIKFDDLSEYFFTDQ
ncbi:MAG: hypothetical protein ABSG15_05745 [FCB group bacterium]